MGAKRVTADYVVPFRQVWEHLGPLCGSNQHDLALVKNECALEAPAASQDHEEEEKDC